MIRLTRLNNKAMVLNSDLVKFVENAPDTVLTLITGEKVLVLESAEEVVQRIVDFRRAVLGGLPPLGFDPNAVARAVTKTHSDLRGRDSQVEQERG